MKFQITKLGRPNFEKPNLGHSLPKFDMKAFMKLPRKEKERYIALAVLLPATVLMFLYGIFTNASEPDEPAQKKAAVVAQQAAEDIPPTQTIQPEAATIQKGGALAQNPFVESSKLAMMDMGNFSTEMPSSYMPMRSLPSISSSPSYTPRPSVPSALPSIPHANPPTPSVPRPASPQSQGTEPTVSGVLTGEDGNNMAIMSDGKVVSAGDNYNGNRIAYIGGDGIKFDNGHSIGYK